MEEHIPNMEHLGIVSAETDKQDIPLNPLQHTETNIQSPDPMAPIARISERLKLVDPRQGGRKASRIGAWSAGNFPEQLLMLSPTKKKENNNKGLSATYQLAASLSHILQTMDFQLASE